LELIQEAIFSLQQETLSYTAGVQLWMKTMALSFVASVLFVYWRVGARWILAGFLVNVIGLIVIRVMWPEFSRTSVGTVIHLLFWPWVLYGVWLSVKTDLLSQQRFRALDWIYYIWLGWASVLMGISLVFDARNLLLM
tara:strand:+ start:27657 stop:28070 length:414 start_codon:yes stop_codon:yes gene_type:complete